MVMVLFGVSLQTVAQDAPRKQVIEVTLTDGSTIKGMMVGTDNGKVLIKTDSLGVVKVALDHIVRLGPPLTKRAEKLATSSPDMVSPEQLKLIQTSLLSDPAVFGTLLSLADDPDLIKIMSDPKVMAIVTSGDLEAAQSNPDIKRVMSNPRIKALVESLVNKTQLNAP